MCEEEEEEEEGRTYDSGDRLPSGVIFCFAAPSPRTIGAFGELVRGVREGTLRSG